MQWVFENWLVLLVGGGMIAMHLFGHGHGHKGARKNAHHDSTKKDCNRRLENDRSIKGKLQ